jgi:hypothetical protein
VVTKALLVEGNDDKHVIWCLLEYHAFPETFEVLVKDGIDNILKLLPVQLKASGLEALGVVVDADLNMGGRWASIKHILEHSGYQTVPNLPSAGGTVISQAEMPRVGIWLMPNNSLPGMLEDFVACLVPEDDPILPTAKAAVIEAMKVPAPFTEVHKSKAEIHTWLAWQDDPGTPMGLAITKRYLDPTAASAVQFIKWLKGLFVD